MIAAAAGVVAARMVGLGTTGYAMRAGSGLVGCALAICRCGSGHRYVGATEEAAGFVHGWCRGGRTRRCKGLWNRAHVSLHGHAQCIRMHAMRTSLEICAPINV